MEMLYFYMLNFTIAHEFAHIAHGHLKENRCNNYIDEIFELDEEEKSRNWATQLKEYDADSLAVMIQSLLFVQQEKADAVMDVISSAGTSLAFILRLFRRFEAPFQV